MSSSIKKEATAAGKDNKQKGENVQFQEKKTTYKPKDKRGKSESKTESTRSKLLGALSKTMKMKKKKGFFWATADVHRGKPVEYIIFSLRDFVFYFIFFVLVLLIAFGDLDYHHNYYGNVVSEVLTNSNFTTYDNRTKTFIDIHKIPEIWVFVKAVVLKVIDNADYESYEEFEGHKVRTESVLVGSVRMRQKRVKRGTCSTVGVFEDVYRTCYGCYSSGNEDQDSFGDLTTSPWTYTEAAIEELEYAGHSATYGTGGFVVDFPSNVNLTAKRIQELEDNLWIRLGSRAVFLEFTLYSPNANLFCTVKLIFEILAAGGVTTDANIVTSKHWHDSSWDWFLLGCKIIFIAYTAYFTLEELFQMVILKESYLANWWNIFDTLIVATCYSVIVSGFVHFQDVRKLSANHRLFLPRYTSFDHITRSLATHKLALTLLTFFVSLKLFKFAILSKPTFFLLSTLRFASTQLVTWALAMTAVLTGFALLGITLLDGYFQFRSFSNSFFTLFGLFVSGLYFVQTNENSLKMEAKIFLGAYILLSVICFSVFTAIVVNAFRKAVFEHNDDRARVYLGDVCEMLMYKMCRKKEKGMLDKEAKRTASRDFDDLLEILRRRGCRGMELALLLKKHNIRPGEPMPFARMTAIYDDFLARRQLLVEVEGHTQIWEKLERIFNTVDFLDMVLGDVWTKMDVLANRMAANLAGDSVEMATNKKRKGKRVNQ